MGDFDSGFVKRKSSPLLQEWRRILGEENVIVTPQVNDVGDFSSRHVTAHLMVRNREDAVNIVRATAEAAVPIPLFPISTGLNWGLGSRKPSADGCAVLDLSCMRRVLQADTARHGYAIVEPGVTFEQLSKQLAGTPYLVNVTASCAKTSVVGNALDRGVGVRGQRSSDLLGLEVLLSNGEIVRLGSFWASLPHAEPTFHYPTDIGPGMLELFLQSNFGIVLSAAFRLVRRAEEGRLVWAVLPHAHLGKGSDGLAIAYERGLMQGVAKVYSATAIKNYGGADAKEEQHTLLGYCCGSKASFPRQQKELVALLRAHHWADVQLLDRSAAAAISSDPGILEALARFEGQPTCEGHRRSFGPTCDLDGLQGRGWLFFLPVIPFNSVDINNAFAALASVKPAAGVSVGATMNILSPRCVDLVVSIHFQRTAEQARPAHAVLDALHAKFASLGYYSYREDIEHQLVPKEASYLRLLATLKRALDPRGIIAPGRYVASSGTGQGVRSFEREARAILPASVYEYYAYQAGRGSSPSHNSELLSKIFLNTRCLTGIANPSTETTLFGQTLGVPVLVAPSAMHGMLNPREMELGKGTARGAASTGAGYVVNAFLSNVSLERICEASVAAHPSAASSPLLWLQVYLYSERGVVQRVLQRAKSLGFSAVCVTCDHPTTLITDLFVPRFRAAADELPDLRLPNLSPEWRPGQPLPVTHDDRLTWPDLEWLVRQTDLPVVAKGILSVDDALAALRCGARGIIVSNHGGRQVDGSRPSIRALPEIARAVAGRVPVLIDTGIRTGEDVVRCLALGASAVLVGRPVLWALAADGSRGVATVLSTLRAELQSAMVHVGAKDVAAITPAMVSWDAAQAKM